jgi:transcriptional regulator with XRE-family HTH domain
MTAARFRLLRATHGLAQADLAAHLGVSRMAVQRWEAGKPIDHPLLLGWAVRSLDAYLKEHPAATLQERRSAAGKQAWKTRLQRKAEQGQEAA